MPKAEFDAFDLKILGILQREGRIANSELAERVGLSPTPCLRRVRALEEAGVIGGYRAALRRQAIGLGLTVFVEIKVDGHCDDNSSAIQEAFREMDEVVSCHLVSGEYDFLVQVAMPDLAAYERFLLGRLLKLPMVKDVRSNFAIREVKLDTPLPLAHLG